MTLAHVFLAPYTLPVPFWMYLYGCAATLILSFALLALFATHVPTASADPEFPVVRGPLAEACWRMGLTILRVGAAGVAILVVAAGFAGPSDPGVNVAMTLFWVWFLLAFAYLTVLVGDIYAWINPWRTLALACDRLGVSTSRARVRYPAVLGYWPAVAGYVALVWIELFALPRPATLAAALACYSVAMLLGAVVFGDVWLRRADVFGVLFRAIGSLAPVTYRAASDGDTPLPRLRWPLRGAVAGDAGHVSLLVFVLFMLSSTTFDTLHDTYVWVSAYWRGLIPLLQAVSGYDLLADPERLTRGYWWYQWIGLVALPGVYLACYLLILRVTRWLSRTRIPTRELAERLTFSLVPVALAYHAAHYLPSMVPQLALLPAQLADPFALGWHWLPRVFVATSPLPMAIVWHGQVGLLLLGHIAGVYVAHNVAVRLFPARSQVLASQIPMLVLMVAYTFLGLWTLSLPIGLPQLSATGG